ncbi:MAG: hypothetical protein LQ340_007537 [Diploschistes diacapsis]|nr:MAG: hypothetical protein LQ340_007537 [Diploschistes diacapsis]
MASALTEPLQSRLARALPASVCLHFHHIVSEPFQCPALFSAPPNQQPELTFCESHFLSASILHNQAPLQVFAIEVLIYTTDALTTLFVSKADSTGYLRLLNLPSGTPSPIKTVLSIFLEYLVEAKRRKDARLVLSLFARAQNQYLFPGSVENSDKHVLDDRGLIKWWCRVVNTILDEYAPAKIPHQSQPVASTPLRTEEPAFTAHAYLVVPGCDAHETRAYFPRASPAVPGAAPRWTSGDPLARLGKPIGLPPRCYIPRFPDDPKARFVVDLDNELPDEASRSSALLSNDLQEGRWRSVRSLPQFWELMTFRQECAAGRLVGFLWVLFEPSGLRDEPLKARAEHTDSNGTSSEPEAGPQLPTPQDPQTIGSGTDPLLTNAPPGPSTQALPETLPSPVPSSQPQATSEAVKETSEQEQTSMAPEVQPLLKAKQSTNVPAGAQLLKDAAYKNVLETLERTDYANVDLALRSTKSFLLAVAQESSLQGWEWGYEVVGENTSFAPPLQASNGEVPSVEHDSSGRTTQAVGDKVQTLGAGLVRKKKRPAEDAEGNVEQAAPSSRQANEPRALGLGVVRKKPRVE